ncbi:MAG TPA: class I SAM-dependent methyltransferase [Bacteroidales bacterium]|nr:class I SAM-dependent methyltransferase [Bacteroidales bacterium]
MKGNQIGEYKHVIRKSLREMARWLFPASVRVDGSVIPSRTMSLAGPTFATYRLYLESAEKEAKRLTGPLQGQPGSRILDLGCGMGRLPTGIIRIGGRMDYTGIDVDEPSIRWCRKYIAKHRPDFRFLHLNIYNERYNLRGGKLGDLYRFPFPDAGFDIIYLFSVFSHTTEEDMMIYLREFNRILQDDGLAFFTTFVSDDGPGVTYNPANCGIRCSGPLHVVQYRKEYLFALLERSGFRIFRYDHATEFDGQSALYLQKKR